MEPTEHARAVDRVQPQRQALRDAQRALALACEGPPAGSDALGAALSGVRTAFAEHVEYAEGAGGLFEELLDDVPGEAASEVDRLRRDHVLINSTLDRADEMLAGGAGPGDERVVEVTTELARLIAAHQKRGAELLYNVYDVDKGGGD
jgi:hypothetical protein